MFRIFSKTIVISISIFIGLIFCEITGRVIGLGKPILYEIDHLVGYRLKPNQRVRRFQNKYITTDQDGFRISKFQKENAYSEKIVFVGDSVTYGGSYIDNKELFSQLFCEISENNYYCLNGAINSWGTHNMGRFISNFELYSKVEPKEFILVFLPGDEKRNLRSFTDTPYWENEPKQPKAINEVLKFFLNSKFIPSLSNKNTSEENISRENKHKRIENAQLKDSIDEFKLQLSKSKYPVNFIITPPERWFKSKSSEEIKTYSLLLEDISKLNIIKKSCNLYDLIRDKYEPDLYVDGIHLSTKGHKIWAESIRSCLFDNS